MSAVDDTQKEAEEGKKASKNVFLEEQIMELQLIESMYPEQMQFFNDKIEGLVLNSMDDFDITKRSDLPSSGDGLPIEFVFSLTSACLEIHFTLPLKYPRQESLSCYVRLLDTQGMTSSQVKQLQNQANSSLTQMINPKDSKNEESESDVNVLSVIQWVEEFERRHLHQDSRRESKDCEGGKGMRGVSILLSGTLCD